MENVLKLLETVLKDCKEIEDRGFACSYSVYDLTKAVATVKNHLYFKDGSGTVKIKTWNEMVQEFGLNSNGNIDINDDYLFTKEMEKQMPEDRIIKVHDNNWNKWTIIKEMISEYKHK